MNEYELNRPGAASRYSTGSASQSDDARAFCLHLLPVTVIVNTRITAFTSYKNTLDAMTMENRRDDHLLLASSSLIVSPGLHLHSRQLTIKTFAGKEVTVTAWRPRYFRALFCLWPAPLQQAFTHFQAAPDTHVHNFPCSWMVCVAEALPCRLTTLSSLVLDILTVVCVSPSSGQSPPLPYLRSSLNPGFDLQAC